MLLSHFKNNLPGGSALLLVALVFQGCATMSRPDSSGQTPEVMTALIPTETRNDTPPTYLEPSRPKVPAETPSAKSRPAITGEASWYGPGFVGKRTASGDIFDEAKFTAAHKTIPLGSTAKVTNLKNGKSVKVEINDRGPFVEGRIIDLSPAAAKALEMVHEGTTKVKIEVLRETAAEEDVQASNRP
jgi:rare lipoprotein A (peptidoglycan hydrolase)